MATVLASNSTAPRRSHFLGSSCASRRTAVPTFTRGLPARRTHAPLRGLTTRAQAEKDPPVTEDLPVTDTVSPADLRRMAYKVKPLTAERDRAKLELEALEMALEEAKKAESILEGNPDATEKPVPSSTLMSIADESPLDYGFQKRMTGAYYDAGPTGVPGNVLKMGYINFRFQSDGLYRELGWIAPEKDPLDKPDSELTELERERKARRGDLSKLTLSNEAIWDREKQREEVGGGINSPWFILGPYYALCYGLDALFDKNPIERFWFLETVARMPYFSYINCLHVYETVGFWRRSAEFRKVHFAEEWNEFHHLLIMESLGGDKRWSTRFLAQHSALLYYLALVILWFVSPSLAYNFSELIEAHAVDTYTEFLEENEELLKTLPPPKIAKLYYEGKDLYLFDEFQTARAAESRRPKVDSLYDVFVNIAEDESMHVSTMNDCQDENSIVRSPNAVRAVNLITAGAIASQIYLAQFSTEVDAAAGAAEGMAASDIITAIVEALTLF